MGARWPFRQMAREVKGAGVAGLADGLDLPGAEMENGENSENGKMDLSPLRHSCALCTVRGGAWSVLVGTAGQRQAVCFALESLDAWCWWCVC